MLLPKGTLQFTFYSGLPTALCIIDGSSSENERVFILLSALFIQEDSGLIILFHLHPFPSPISSIPILIRNANDKFRAGSIISVEPPQISLKFIYGLCGRRESERDSTGSVRWKLARFKFNAGACSDQLDPQ
jgi:hypothetical protein